MNAFEDDLEEFVKSELGSKFQDSGNLDRKVVCLSAGTGAVHLALLAGVGRMVDACRAQGVPEPEYEVAGGFVRIIFKRPLIIGSDRDDSRNGYVNGYVNGEVNTLTPSQKLVYDTVNNNPGIQTKQIADVLKRSPRTIEKHLAFLAKSCFIEHRDSDKTGGYYVTENKNENK